MSGKERTERTARFEKIELPLDEKLGAFLAEEARKAGLTEGEYLSKLVDAEAGGGEWTRDGWLAGTRAAAERAAEERARKLWPVLRRRCKGKGLAEGLMALRELEREGVSAVRYARRGAEIAAEFLWQASRADGDWYGGLVEEARRLCGRLVAVCAEISVADIHAHDVLNGRLVGLYYPRKRGEGKGVLKGKAP